MSSKTINTILNLKDNFSKGISSATSSTKQFQRQIKQAENQANKMKSGITGSFSSTAAKIAGALGLIGLGEFAKSSLMLASDLNEVQNVVDTTFGSMSEKINVFAKTTSSQFGISELQAKQFSGVLGAMMKSSGITGDELTNMSTGLAGLAGDMASFYNLDPAEAFEKIKSAIGGETEPMKALGVNMSVANMEAFALTQGINKQWKEMSQAEQTTLRYKYLMKNTADAQGDYAKTSTGFANQLRTMKLNFQTLGASIMSYAIPPLQKLFSKINDLVTKIDVKSWIEKLKGYFDILKNSMQYIVPIISGVIGGILGFMAISKVLSIVSLLKNIIAGTTTVLKAFNLTLLANPITWIAIGIGVLIAAMVYAYKYSETFRNFINQLWEKFKEFGTYLATVIPPILQQVATWFTTTIVPALQSIGDKLLNLWNTVILPFITWLVTTLTPVFQAIFPIIKQIVMDTFNAIGTVIQSALQIFGGIIDFVTGVFTGNWSLAWQGVVDIFGGIFSGLAAVLKVPLNAVIGLINGAIGQINSAIQIDVPDWVPEFGGKHFGLSIPQIPMLYKGTDYFKGGPALVGERGPELVNMPSGSTVTTADKTKQILNGNAPIFNIYFNGNVGTKEFFDQAGEHIINKVNLALANM